LGPHTLPILLRCLNVTALNIDSDVIENEFDCLGGIARLLCENRRYVFDASIGIDDCVFAQIPKRVTNRIEIVSWWKIQPNLPII
jgi:hypothetical protein